MYFEHIFRAVADRQPGLRIVVRSDYPVSKYPHLPLWPTLRQWFIPLSRRLPSGVVYRTELAVPNPSFLAGLLRLRSAVFVTIEFTPVSLLVQALALLTGRRLLLLIESDPSLRGAPQKPLVVALKRFFARRAGLVQTNNAAGAKFVREVLRVPADRLRVAPYLTSEIPGSRSAASAPVAAGIRLLFVNTLTARKGLGEFLTGWAQAPAGVRTRLHLDVVGSGDQEQELAALAERLGLAHQVRFHGRVEHARLGPYYRDTDWVVCPTLGDYRSLAGFEGINAGKPLLMSIYDGACDELLIDGTTGYRLDPRSPARVAAILAQVCEARDQGREWSSDVATLASSLSVAAIADNISASIALLRGGD
jgi:glycosyltransferase involved in cell wall biosynthesis